MKFSVKKTIQFYIVLIIAVNQFDKLTMKMLKSVRKNTFTSPIFTMADDAELFIYEFKDIICILSDPCKNGGGVGEMRF